MTFPPQVAALLEAYRIAPETKSALYELYVGLGAPLLEEFAELAESIPPHEIRPEDLSGLRQSVIEKYVQKSLPRWRAMEPTESFWRPRIFGGRMAGFVTPLGPLESGAGEYPSEVERVTRCALDQGEPVPAGLIIMGRNAHLEGRPETITFDVVVDSESDAIEIALAAGKQQTLPGSVGATAGTLDPTGALALIWEIQANVLEPNGGSSSSLAAVWERQRNWDVATLAAALVWLEARARIIYVVRGDALPTAGERGSASVPELHDRLVERVVTAMGSRLADPMDEETDPLLETDLMDEELHRVVTEKGAAAALWRIDALRLVGTDGVA
ncbi:MAG: hypothetical protein WBX15_06885 [Thermoanaerobaculia bacterium]